MSISDLADMKMCQHRARLVIISVALASPVALLFQFNALLCPLSGAAPDATCNRQTVGDHSTGGGENISSVIERSAGTAAHHEPDGEDISASVSERDTGTAPYDETDGERVASVSERSIYTPPQQEPDALVREYKAIKENRTCNDTQRRADHFFIKAERHHGSNVMRLLIERNTNLTNKDGRYNWKHGFLFPVYHPLPRMFDGATAMLIITRDVFHWLPRMHRETYGDMNRLRGLPFSRFIRARYREKCGACTECGPFNGACQEPFEEADNLVRIRTLKYKNWVYMDPKWFGRGSMYAYSTRSLMRYESLLEDGQEAVLRRFLGEHCVPTKEGNLKLVRRRATSTGERRKQRFIPESNEEVLSKYSEDDIRFVLDQLDRDFESRILNYSYSYVEDYLRSRQLANSTLL